MNRPLFSTASEQGKGSVMLSETEGAVEASLGGTSVRTASLILSLSKGTSRAVSPTSPSGREPALSLPNGSTGSRGG